MLIEEFNISVSRIGFVTQDPDFIVVANFVFNGIVEGIEQTDFTIDEDYAISPEDIGAWHVYPKNKNIIKRKIYGKLNGI